MEAFRLGSNKARRLESLKGKWQKVKVIKLGGLEARTEAQRL